MAYSALFSTRSPRIVCQLPDIIMSKPSHVGFVASVAMAKRMITTTQHKVGSVRVNVDSIEIPGSPSIATVVMSNPKANTFDYNSLFDLASALNHATKLPNLRGLILTSDINGIFSAGFNLPIFHNITEDYFTRLMEQCRIVFRILYSLPVPTVAAVNGHALGMGSIFALACQSRFMINGKGKIGLNEVSLGMPVPEWLVVRFKEVVGSQIAERLLPIGETLKAEGAREIGLIDDVFSSEQEMSDAAIKFLSERARVSYFAQSSTIKALRRPYLTYFDANYESDNQIFWSAISSPQVQAQIESILRRIKENK